MPASDPCIKPGFQDRPVTLTDEDLALLRLTQERGQIYASDNEAKWNRLLEADLLEAAPNPERRTDWHGGWMQISEAGRAVLAQIDQPTTA